VSNNLLETKSRVLQLERES